MGDDKRNYVLVGGFVLAMGAALIGWILLLSGGMGATHPYFVVYRNVMGLKEGVDILYEGFPVGRIEEIGPMDREGRRQYRVDILVRQDTPIPQDSKARITTGLFSAPVIDIQAGDSQEKLEPGAEIPAQEAADPFAAVGEFAGNLQGLLDQEIQPLLATLRERTPLVLDDVDKFTHELNRILAPENVERIRNILANLDDSSEALTPVLSDLGQTRRTLDSLIARVDQMVAKDDGEVAEALAELNHSLAAVSRHIDAITANLETATRNLAEASQQVRENPAVLVRGRQTGDGQ